MVLCTSLMYWPGSKQLYQVTGSLSYIPYLILAIALTLILKSDRIQTRSRKIDLSSVYSNHIIMEVTLNQHIEITPGVRGGKARIAGTRMTVADIATLYLQMGQSLDLIAGKYHLSLASVYAAMAYYYDHRHEIEKSIQEDKTFADSLQSNYPSRLQAKLKELHRHFSDIVNISQ